MSIKNDVSRVTIDIPINDRKKLKMSAMLGKSMREIILEAITTHLCSSNYPNKETLEAIQDVRNGKNLTEAKDINDLFEKLGI